METRDAHIEGLLAKSLTFDPALHYIVHPTRMHVRRVTVVPPLL